MLDPVLSEAPPSMDVTPTVLFCVIHGYKEVRNHQCKERSIEEETNAKLSTYRSHGCCCIQMSQFCRVAANPCIYLHSKQ